LDQIESKSKIPRPYVNLQRQRNVIKGLNREHHLE